ncbi:serine acetyltransferase-like [Ylistrum balloti]|uniref:serine acetyltransferase-like n=1 Tax=Ylistrum balloti TaxID=509963 RepID=UPI002905A422|nr:serine acetyltransferase-like [Ylistrum balloti]
MTILDNIKKDIAIVFERDPAARSWLEVVLTYPGVHALVMHRFNHYLWQRGFKLLSRVLAHLTRLLTGIEIHPGAQIGQRVFIDHGMGIVIGETAEVGSDVTLYHGVTLGGTSQEKTKRHPTIENHVVLGAGANILGPVSIGHHTRIGAGSVVVTDVPNHCTVVGIPGRIVQRRGLQDDDETLDHGNLPDPSALLMEQMVTEIDTLKQRLLNLERDQYTDKQEP